MNQIKIGKFIAKCRKEKELTQQELADKLGVTDKAISKWENGRCLMDISLLKPLSECLDISVIELINGEKILSEDVSVKSSEAVEKTIIYAKRKIKKSRIRIISVVSLICIFLIFLSYKGSLLYFYNVPRSNIDEIVDDLKFKDTMTIYKKTIDEDEYFITDEFKIRNVFSNFEEVERVNEMWPYQFILKDSNDKTIGSITFGPPYNSLVEIFGSEDTVIMGGMDQNTWPIDIGQFDSADRKDFLLQNDINDDIDFLKYIGENCYIKNNIFTSPKIMKKNYAINLFTSIAIPDVDSLTLINGDYDGYIYNLEVNNKKIREVHILRNDRNYAFSFIGKDFTSDEYIYELLSTLEIK